MMVSKAGTSIFRFPVNLQGCIDTVFFFPTFFFKKEGRQILRPHKMKSEEQKKTWLQRDAINGCFWFP